MAINDPYNVLPPLSDDEYQALKEDIRVNGVRVPVYRDEAGGILDGFHRRKACEELGIIDYPVQECVGLTDDQKLEMSLTLNLTRRHLTRGARQPIAVQLRQRAWSLERIARVLGVGTSTVHRWLEDVSRMENVATPHVIMDTKGRTQPVRKPRRPQALKAAKLAVTEAASPGPEGSPPPALLPVRREAHVRLNQPAVDTSTDPSQAPEEPPAPQVADDPGQQVRTQIDRLHEALSPLPNRRALRTVTRAWPASQKAQYRRRCTVLISALKALRETLSTAEMEGEEGGAVEAMASADDEFSNLQEVTL